MPLIRKIFYINLFEDLIMRLFYLFIIFFKTSLLSFGGGYAMISMLFDELTRKKIIARKDLFDIITVSQIAPGPIATNMAIFIGYKIYKFLGALIAILGVCLPSFAIAIIFAGLISKLNQSSKFKFIKDIIYGLKSVSVSLIFIVFIKLFCEMCLYKSANSRFLLEIKSYDIKRLVLFILAFSVLYKFKNINILIVILSFGLIGIIFL